MASKKLKMARKMMSKYEVRTGKSPFLSDAWTTRKINRSLKESKKRK